MINQQTLKPTAQGASATVSSDEVAGGLPLAGIDPAAAAKVIMDTVGKGGVISTATINQFMDLNGTTSEAGHVRSEVDRGWGDVAHTDQGAMTLPQLTDAIQGYMKAAANTPVHAPLEKLTAIRI